VALAIHVAAFPIWFIQAFLWEFPGQTPQQAARTEKVVMAYGAVVAVAYLALFAALVIWWRQGRERLFLSPLVAAALAWLPCLVVLVVAAPVRRALIPPRVTEVGPDLPLR
jgi:hypothetical protein